MAVEIGVLLLEPMRLVVRGLVRSGRWGGRQADIDVSISPHHLQTHVSHFITLELEEARL